MLHALASLPFGASFALVLGAWSARLRGTTNFEGGRGYETVGIAVLLCPLLWGLCFIGYASLLGAPSGYCHSLARSRHRAAVAVVLTPSLRNEPSCSSAPARSVDLDPRKRSCQLSPHHDGTPRGQAFQRHRREDLRDEAHAAGAH